ncbi:MAG: DUF1735 domain-containing protein [Niabella sp.]
MKLKLYFAIACILMSLASCDKYYSGINDAENYKNVYMPRASSDSTVLTVTRDEAVFTLPYSAYLGGPAAASGDISVSFAVDESQVSVFNTKYGTNYPVLPAANYTFSGTASVIKAGERSTEKLTLTVQSNEDLALFKTYILPVSIKTVDGAGSHLGENYTTTYFLIRVGQEEVLNLGANWGGIYCVGPKNTIISNDSVSKDILMYIPNDEGVYDQDPLHIGIYWDASESFYYINENAMLVRNAPYWAGLFRFDMYPENIAQTNTTPTNIIVAKSVWAEFWLGDFWNQYLIVPFGDYQLTIDNGGALWRQPVFSYISSNRTQVATGFERYSQVLSYPSKQPTGLVCVTADGDLWYYSLSDLAVPDAGKKVGSGWAVFKKIIISDNDILALSSTNGVYRIPFDPDQTYDF